jgi:hypothetical protein
VTPARPPRQSLLVEEVPLLTNETQRERIRAALMRYARFASFPLVLVHSFKEHIDEDMDGLLTEPLLRMPRVTCISCRPLARRFMTKALRRVVAAERLTTHLNAIIAEADGDLRQAMNALQFASSGMARSEPPTVRGRRTGRANKRKRTAVPAATKDTPSDASPLGEMPAAQRDTAVSLFSAVGRVVYNKSRLSVLPVQSSPRVDALLCGCASAVCVCGEWSLYMIVRM